VILAAVAPDHAAAVAATAAAALDHAPDRARAHEDHAVTRAVDHEAADGTRVHDRAQDLDHDRDKHTQDKIGPVLKTIPSLFCITLFYSRPQLRKRKTSHVLSSQKN